jgi:hypothetical protein
VAGGTVRRLAANGSFVIGLRPRLAPEVHALDFRPSFRPVTAALQVQGYFILVSKNAVAFLE